MNHLKANLKVLIQQFIFINCLVELWVPALSKQQKGDGKAERLRNLLSGKEAVIFDFDNVKARYNVVKAEYDAARAKVLEMLEARGQFYILPEDRDKPLKVVEAVTERLDTKRLREEMPDVAKKYTKTAIVRSLR